MRIFQYDEIVTPNILVALKSEGGDNEYIDG